MPLKWCDEANDAVDKLMSDTNRDVDFVMFAFNKKKSEMLLTASGKGGRAKVEELLSSGCEDKVLTGAFLALAVDKRGSVVSTRRKYIHFTWVGPSVGVMVKGRVNSVSGDFRQKFPSSVMYLQLMGDLDELDEKVLEKNLLACGGAHKPSGYDFTNAALEDVKARKAPAAEVKSEAAETPSPPKEVKSEPVETPAAETPSPPEEVKPETPAPETPSPPKEVKSELVETEEVKSELVETEEVKPEPVLETPSAETEPVKAPVGGSEEAPGVAAATDSEGE